MPPAAHHAFVAYRCLHARSAEPAAGPGRAGSSFPSSRPGHGGCPGPSSHTAVGPWPGRACAAPQQWNPNTRRLGRLPGQTCTAAAHQSPRLRPPECPAAPHQAALRAMPSHLFGVGDKDRPDTAVTAPSLSLERSRRDTHPPCWVTAPCKPCESWFRTIFSFVSPQHFKSKQANKKITGAKNSGPSRYGSGGWGFFVCLHWRVIKT